MDLPTSRKMILSNNRTYGFYIQGGGNRIEFPSVGIGAGQIEVL